MPPIKRKKETGLCTEKSLSLLTRTCRGPHHVEARVGRVPPWTFPLLRSVFGVDGGGVRVWNYVLTVLPNVSTIKKRYLES